jgi:hypothetical protein
VVSLRESYNIAILHVMYKNPQQEGVKIQYYGSI